MRAINVLSLLPAALLAAGTVFPASAARAGEVASVHVTVKNDLPLARSSETIELSQAAIAAAEGNGATARALSSDLSRVHVFEQGSGHEVLAQALDLDADGTPESLIFQTDVPASGQRVYVLRAGDARTNRREDFRVYGRFVRERYDDFAWENDRIAHRMYGAALETWEKEPLTSSTVDVWLKRTRRLVINDWYLVDDYHRDHGEGGDFYSAGRSRGCGGSGVWRDGKLVVSKNFRDSRVLANGPIRLVFELKYPAWDAAGIRSEVKRISLDAGQNFNHFESRYDLDAVETLLYATGIKKWPDAALRVDRAAGVVRTWGPVKGAAGQYGCAIVIDPASIADVTEADGNHLVVARAVKARASYWAGAAWDQSGDFSGVAEWDRYVDQWAQRIRTPLRVEVTVP
jgi:hypothetical protein